jgi:RNA polymerase sigma-70 factor (ECF subfamily)
MPETVLPKNAVHKFKKFFATLLQQLRYIDKEGQYTSLEPTNDAGYTPELQCNKDFSCLISPLSDDEKVIFILKYIYAHQSNEIADLVNIKAGTLKSKISRAMDKLK